jgi:hypothetical protein
MADIPYQSADRFGSTVNIWVYVETEGEENKALIAPFWVPKGTWTLVWNLVTLHLDRGAPLATFAAPGILLKSGEHQRLVVLKEGRASDTQYWMTVENMDAPEQALLGYDILFGGGLRMRQVYDPTIIVATDPIDPPPGEGGPQGPGGR